MFSGRIQNCFDSHVHWAATGNFARRLRLHELRDPHELFKIQPKKENEQSGWLLGFGWDQNLFADKKFPTREILDQRFGDTPVIFTRIDGHASWVNTAALKLAGLFKKDIVSREGGLIPLGADQYPNGILIDLAMFEVEGCVPKPTQREIKSDLLAGQTLFHQAGFTHIRDLTCENDQWEAQCQLEKSGELKLAVEQFFSADDPKDFTERVRLAKSARHEAHDLLRPKGVKIYFDGALGSEGAFLSRPYLSGSGVGLKLVDDNVLKEMIEVGFREQLEVAVHVIGDEAAHRVALMAANLKSRGVSGQLHFEHAELLRPETIALMKKTNVISHMQPSHWLSDKRWLKEKIGDLSQFAFQWKELEKAGLHFDFGSDSPIEETSLARTFEALEDANQNGIPRPEKSFSSCQSHPDFTWVANTYSDFINGSPQSVYFCGEKLI